MNEREIRAYLRGATLQRIIVGWQVVGLGLNKRFVINPIGGPTHRYFRNEAEAYCRMLADAGVEPVYRASEPKILP